MKVCFPHTLPFIISVSFVCIGAWSGGVLITRLLWGTEQKYELVTPREAGSFLIQRVLLLTGLGSIAALLWPPTEPTSCCRGGQVPAPESRAVR